MHAIGGVWIKHRAEFVWDRTYGFKDKCQVKFLIDFGLIEYTTKDNAGIKEFI